MANIRYIQSQVAQNPQYLNLIVMAMRYGAYRVATEPADTPNHSQRRAVAESIMQGMPVDATRFRDFFAAYALFDSAVQGQVYNPATGTVTPQNIQDADIDRVILDGWNIAAAVVEGDAEPQ